MKAAVLKAPNMPFVIEQLPDPTPGPGEAVARVISCGSGLTIQHVRAGRIPVDYPRIIGHEITGEIVAVGSDVRRLSTGDAVTAYFYLTCGHCRWCRINRETLCENFAGYVGREIDGGYAEYIKLPADNFINIPKNLDIINHPAEIGVICDAVATPVKVLKHARIQPGETVAVMGAGGGLGIHMIMMCRWAHTKVIAVDTAAQKFDACRKAGADQVVDASKENVAEALLDFSEGKGIDAVVDFVSSTSTLESGIDALGRGGRLVTLGGAGEPFQAHAKALLTKEIEILGSRYATRQEVIDALDLVARGEVWPMVTEIYQFEEVEAVHDRLEQSLVTGRAALMIK